jgi:hypothetical protein
MGPSMKAPCDKAFETVPSMSSVSNVKIGEYPVDKLAALESQSCARSVKRFDEVSEFDAIWLGRFK